MVIIFQMFLWVTGSLSGPETRIRLLIERAEGGRHYFIPFLFAGHPQKLETSHAATQSEAGKIPLFISIALRVSECSMRH